MGTHNHCAARPSAQLSASTLCLTVSLLYNAICGRFAKVAGCRRHTSPAVALCLGEWVGYHLLGDFVRDSNGDFVSSLPVTDETFKIQDHEYGALTYLPGKNQRNSCFTWLSRTYIRPSHDRVVIPFRARHWLHWFTFLEPWSCCRYGFGGIL